MKQSELLRKQADMIDMAEKYGVDDWRKLVKVSNYPDAFYSELNTKERIPDKELAPWHFRKFAIGVVEGRPVFSGDYLYLNGSGFCADDSIDDKWLVKYAVTWNPHKPKTVMVELLVDDVERMSDPNEPIYSHMKIRLGEACLKALEESC